jgi:hypothetical protein
MFLSLKFRYKYTKGNFKHIESFQSILIYLTFQVKTKFVIQSEYCKLAEN